MSTDWHKVKGVVNYINEKNFKGVVYFGFFVRDVEGFFRHGQVRPTFNKGDEIEFEFQETKHGNQVNIDSVEIIEKASAKATPTKAAGRDDYWLRKEQRDLVTDEARARGASLNTAVAMVTAALDKDILPIGGTKKDAKWEQFTTLVFKVAEEVYDYTQRKPAAVSEDAVEEEEEDPFAD